MSSEDIETVSVSVVMPAYNEEASIRGAVEDVVTHILDRVEGSELIVVNDGSKDDTGYMLDDISSKDPRVKVYHQSNSGHGPAIMTGLGKASGDYVFLIDSDRQTPLTRFSRFWELAEDGYDGVFGVRRQRDDPAIRLWLTYLVRKSIAVLFGASIYDANVPFKLLRRRIWADAKEHIPEGTLAPSLFLAIYVKKKGYRVKELEISHQERRTGEVSIKRWKLIKFCASSFLQMWQFRKSIRYVK